MQSSHRLRQWFQFESWASAPPSQIQWKFERTVRLPLLPPRTHQRKCPPCHPSSRWGNRRRVQWRRTPSRQLRALTRPCALAHRKPFGVTSHRHCFEQSRARLQNLDRANQIPSVSNNCPPPAAKPHSRWPLSNAQTHEFLAALRWLQSHAGWATWRAQQPQRLAHWPCWRMR